MRRPFSPSTQSSPADPHALTDMEALKASEQHFRALAETAQLAIISIDDQGSVIFWNPAAEAMFGYSTEEMLGTPVSRITPPDQRAAHLEGLARARQGLERRAVGKTLDLLGCRADGTSFPIQLSLAEWEAEGRSYFTAIIRDMSQQVALDEARLAATEGLKESNRDLESFAYVASHDLQEPLRKIIAFGERLEVEAGDTLSERGQLYLDRMVSSALRMQQMIDDLLELSRVTTRGARFERLDLAEVVATVLMSLEEEIARADARIAVGSLPVIQADRMQMQQLFQNLLTNALKFRLADRAVEIHVRAEAPEPESAGTESVRVAVKDNGIGFDPKYREQAFQPFERLHARSAFEGTGIGASTSATSTKSSTRPTAPRPSHGRCGTVTIEFAPVYPGIRIGACRPSEQPRTLSSRFRDGTVGRSRGMDALPSPSQYDQPYLRRVCRSARLFERGALLEGCEKSARNHGGGAVVTLDLKPRHRRMVEAILAARLPGIPILVYGSRARGDAVPHSDLDLMIDASEPVDEILLAQLDADFAESDLPFRVEVVDGTSISQAFRRRIEVDLAPLEVAVA
jgi:PAS domain S-box-containing protein